MRLVSSVVVRRALCGAGIGTLLVLSVACGGSGNSITRPGLGNGSNNSVLHGQYAFSFSGQSRSSGALISGVGMFTADGNGNITGGMQDANIGNGSRTFNFTGKYSVGSDLRGTAVLTGLQVCPNWQFTMRNASHALLTCFDSGNTGSGSIDIQDTTAFSAAKLVGNYVFGLSGAGVNSNSVSPVVAIAGQWTMDGVGTITSGTMDINDGFALAPAVPLTGTYTVASNGRGTLTVHNTAYSATQNFAFYIVNATDFKILETDTLSTSTPFTSGEVLAQAAAPFSFNTANAGFVFTVGGLDPFGVAVAEGGVFTSNGAGGLSSVVDVNDGGTTNLGFPSAGTYSVTSSGRALITMNSGFSSLTFAAYPAANGTWQLAELDANGVTAGMAKVQSGGPFNNASVSGSFALNWSGTLNPASQISAPSEEDITGQLVADGVSNLSGTLDVNSFSNIIQGLPVSSGSYNMGGNGYGSAIISTQAAGFNMQLYQADANTVLFLDTDPTRVMLGLMQK